MVRPRNPFPPPPPPRWPYPKLLPGNEMVYTVPGTLSMEDRERIRRQLELALPGRTVLVVDGGATLEPVGSPPKPVPKPPRPPPNVLLDGPSSEDALWQWLMRLMGLVAYAGSVWAYCQLAMRVQGGVG